MQPASDAGKAILAIVENGEELPTQGKIEAALLPLYEATTADFYAAKAARPSRRRRTGRA